MTGGLPQPGWNYCRSKNTPGPATTAISCSAQALGVTHSAAGAALVVGAPPGRQTEK